MPTVQINITPYLRILDATDILCVSQAHLRVRGARGDGRRQPVSRVRRARARPARHRHRQLRQQGIYSFSSIYRLNFNNT